MPLPHDINMDQARKSAGQTQEKEASGGACTKNQEKLLEQIRCAPVECFGGCLLRRENEYGLQLLSFAVSGMTDRERMRAENKYEALFRSYLPFMIHSASPSRENAGEYTVFNFSIGPKMRSLRELCRDGECREASVLRVMKRLVNLIVSYYNYCQENDLAYEPLNCLTLDTVFVDASNNLILVPLQSYRGKFAPEMPPEVHHGERMDEKSDLYAAAMLAVEVASGGSLDNPVAEIPGIIRDCMAGIPAYRPNLKRVCDALRSSGGTQTDDAAKADGPREEKSVFGWSGWWRKIILGVQQFFAKMGRYMPEEKERVIHKTGTFRMAHSKAQKIPNIDLEQGKD